MDPILQVKDLDLWYGAHQALHSVSMDIPEKSITAFIGPSGCGKSTFLKTLNRMNDLVPGVKITGQVRYRGEDIYAPGTDVCRLRREIGMVFQKPNPFPMSIYDNIAYGVPVDHALPPAPLQQGLQFLPPLLRLRLLQRLQNLSRHGIQLALGLLAVGPLQFLRLPQQLRHRMAHLLRNPLLHLVLCGAAVLQRRIQGPTHSALLDEFPGPEAPQFAVDLSDMLRQVQPYSLLLQPPVQQHQPLR